MLSEICNSLLVRRVTISAVLFALEIGILLASKTGHVECEGTAWVRKLRQANFSIDNIPPGGILSMILVAS